MQTILNFWFVQDISVVSYSWYNNTKICRLHALGPFLPIYSDEVSEIFVIKYSGINFTCYGINKLNFIKGFVFQRQLRFHICIMFIPKKIFRTHWIAIDLIHKIICYFFSSLNLHKNIYMEDFVHVGECRRF